MDRLQQIISDLERYAKNAGTDPGVVCRRATGNPRLFERLKRRIDQTEHDVQRLRDYMAKNPPLSEDDAA